MPSKPLTSLAFAGIGKSRTDVPVVEAALMQAVPASIRASFFGLFITIGGLLGNGSHWLVGRWVEAMVTASRTPETYRPLYGILGGLLALSVVGLPCLRSFARNRPRESGAGMVKP